MCGVGGDGGGDGGDCDGDRGDRGDGGGDGGDRGDGGMNSSLGDCGTNLPPGDLSIICCCPGSGESVGMGPVAYVYPLVCSGDSGASSLSRLTSARLSGYSSLRVSAFSALGWWRSWCLSCCSVVSARSRVVILLLCRSSSLGCVKSRFFGPAALSCRAGAVWLGGGVLL